jgi:hypothetical protein
MKDNRISEVITPEQATAVLNSIEAIHTALSHVLVINLTNEDRFNMLKMGDKTLAFVHKSLEYAQQNPNLTPKFLDLPEAQKDYKLSSDLYAIVQKVNTLLRAVEDVTMVAGSEAYAGALVFYQSVKGAAKSNEPGAQAIYDDLKKRVPGKGKGSATNN